MPSAARVSSSLVVALAVAETIARAARRLVRRDSFCVLVLVGLAACADGGEAPPPPPPTAVVRVPVAQLAYPRDAGAPEIDVAQATPEELAQGWPGGAAEGAAMGGGLLGVGLFEGLVLGAPMAGGVVVGGIILLPALVVLGAVDEANRAALAAALAESRIAERTREALAARFTAAGLAPRAPRPLRLEVRFATLGFVAPEGRAGACFSADVRYRLHEGERVLFADRILWSAWRRSADMPPPVCAMMDVLAADQAARAREALEEAAPIIAAAIARRLGVTS